MEIKMDSLRAAVLAYDEAFNSGRSCAREYARMVAIAKAEPTGLVKALVHADTCQCETCKAHA